VRTLGQRCVLFIELYWCFPVQITVSLAGVVEPFDVFEHRVSKFNTGVPTLSIEEFDLHAAPEGLNHCIVVRVVDGAKEWQEPCLLGALGEMPRR
jgi:hypothetical protein